MADDIIVDQQAVDSKVELANQMAIALGTAPPAEIQQQAAAAQTTTEQQQTAAVDYFSQIKEKFGYENHEAAIKEIEDLRAFKAAPPEYEFENEDSAKLFKAWQAGKKNEVYQYLAKEQQIDQFLGAEVTADNAANVVKLGMQLKYKDLSPAEIDYKFKKTFAVPPKPVQASDEEQDEYNIRLGAWQETANDKAMELLIEAKLAKPELEAAKSKLVFPEIADSQDEGYSQYKKALEQQILTQVDQARKDAEAQAAYKAFTPKSIETKLPFIDEPNKINFEFQYEPDPESFAKSQAMAFDVTTFFDSYYDKDGNPDRRAFLEDIYFAKNKKTIILEAIKQGKNAAIRAMLPDNSQSGMVRQMNTVVEMSDLDKAMQGNGIRRQ